MPVEIDVTDITDQELTAKEVFESLAGRFPEIADLLHRGYSESEAARVRHWHLKSLRMVLSDYRAILRRARIFTVEDWQRLLRQAT